MYDAENSALNNKLHLNVYLLRKHVFDQINAGLCEQKRLQTVEHYSVAVYIYEGCSIFGHIMKAKAAQRLYSL